MRRVDQQQQGAPTGLVTTEGFRDTLQIRNESRYEQYDLDIDLPEPLVPRRLRLPVPERMDASRCRNSLKTISRGNSRES